MQSYDEWMREEYGTDLAIAPEERKQKRQNKPPVASENSQPVVVTKTKIVPVIHQTRSATRSRTNPYPDNNGVAPLQFEEWGGIILTILLTLGLI